MTGGAAPLLWIFGPPGFGKSVVGFMLFSQLAARGSRLGFVDTDQLGILRPADEAAQALVKGANLIGALRSFSSAGVDGVIVSGDIADDTMGEVLRQGRPAAQVLCQLRAHPDLLESRLRGRGAPPEYVQAAHAYDRQRRIPADMTVVTDGRAVADVASEIRQRLGEWPRQPRSTARRATGRDLDQGGYAPVPSAILVSGPTAVGKSSVAWELVSLSVAAGVTTAFLDLGQIGFVRPPDGRDPAGLAVKSRNLGVMSRNFAARGVRRLVICGDISGQADIDAYRAALPGSRLRVCVLTAGQGRLRERLTLRRDGRAIELPGDEIRGDLAIRLDDVAATAARRGRLLAHSVDSDFTLPTDSLKVRQAARRISANLFPGDASFLGK